MMKSNHRVPLSLGGLPNRNKADFDDQTMMTEFTKQTTASAPPTLFQFNSAHNPPTAHSKKHNHGRRRASTSFVPHTKEGENEFGFPNTTSSGDPFASEGNAWNARGFPSSTTAKRAPQARRSSVDGITPFGEDPFVGMSSATKPPKHHHSSRQTGPGNALASADNFASFDDFTADAPKKLKPQPPAPMIPSNGAGARANPCQEIALPPLIGSDKPTTRKPATKENPLLSIPDPLSEHRQKQKEDFFAEMPANKQTDDFFADSALGASTPFSDDDASDEGDFSDEGTILWEEGGVIVSKAEKYNRSSGSLNASFSFLNSSGGNLKFDQSKLKGSNNNNNNNNNKASRRSLTERKRLDGLERRNSRRGMDDDLTTATPSTRISTDSEYSVSTARSKKSTSPGVELKTGSLLSDLVLIMDGKMEIPGGKEKEGSRDKETRPSRHRSAGGNENGTRQSRRRPVDGTDNSDPFVVRQEVRGENMKSFSRVSRSKSNDFDGFKRRPPGRTKSSTD